MSIHETNGINSTWHRDTYNYSHNKVKLHGCLQGRLISKITLFQVKPKREKLKCLGALITEKLFAKIFTSEIVTTGYLLKKT